jgi:hypothetical protein
MFANLCKSIGVGRKGWDDCPECERLRAEVEMLKQWYKEAYRGLEVQHNEKICHMQEHTRLKQIEAAVAAKSHPARKVLADLPAKEIADALGVAPTYVYAMKKNLTKAMADRIIEACGDGTAPPGKAAELARQYREAQKPPATYAEEKGLAIRGKPGRKLSPSMDLVKQLLEVKGAFLVIPLAALDKLKGAGHD